MKIFMFPFLPFSSQYTQQQATECHNEVCSWKCGKSSSARDTGKPFFPVVNEKLSQTHQPHLPHFVFHALSQKFPYENSLFLHSLLMKEFFIHFEEIFCKIRSRKDEAGADDTMRRKKVGCCCWRSFVCLCRP